MTRHNPTWPVWSLGEAVNRLPAAARRKLSSLEAQLADYDALERTSHQRHLALEDSILKAQYRVGNLHRDDADDIAELNDEVALMQADLAKLDAERARRSAAKGNLMQVLAELRAWIGATADRLSALRVVSVHARPRDRETISDAIMRLRHDIMTTHGEIAQLRSAPLPADEARAKLIQQIDAMAARGRPSLKLESGQAEIRFPDEPLFSNPGQPMGAPAGSASAIACWLWRDEMIEALTSGLDSIEGAVASHERPAREAELRSKLLELERDEESLIGQAIEAGLDAHRRIGASPLAILGLGYASATVQQAAE
jgi:uncharacterized small protein (DUF1192 family)